MDTPEIAEAAVVVGEKLVVVLLLVVVLPVEARSREELMFCDLSI